MGEEEKKPEEKKPAGAEEAKKPVSEEKKEEKPAAEEKKKKTEESKEEAAPATPPPPQEIVLKVFMHCEGCARKVRRCLKGFDGVEDVTTDCKTHKVVVKGEKADPVKVRDRVQQKSHRQVELLSPIPKPPAADNEKKVEEKEMPKLEEKKPEPPKIIRVVLKVHMHCEACAQEIKKRILRMSGVESAEADLKSSQVNVKGVFDPPKLVDYVYKRTGKHAVIVKQEAEEKKDEEEKGKGKEGKEGKKVEAESEEKKEEEKEKKEGKIEGSGEEVNKVVETKINEFHYYPPRYGMELYAYPPQIFSDENPNACSIM